ncbi:MAG: hypothetical protein FWD23_11915 [Oscillospiraceae bacterium]|nr:hypothetical protein [Oscillospiraceae bacterium]
MNKEYNPNGNFTDGFWFGVDNAGDRDPRSINFDILKRLGARFIVWHTEGFGSVEAEEQKAGIAMKQCEKNGIYFLCNVEIANWFPKVVGPDGHDWANGEDGCHYFRFPDKVLAAYNSSPYFAGVVYDEAEHMQINRNWIWENGKKNDMPFFSDTNEKSFQQAFDGFVEYGARVADGYFQKGTPYLITEHVWPALFHAFASMGFTPAYKQLKESWSNIWAVMALGAARQYGRELWTCIDLWHLGDYPGHSPEELKYNMIFAYLIGCDKAYVENLSYEGSLYSNRDGADVLSRHGETVEWFSGEYLKNNKRTYTHRDYMPSVAVIRFDDTDGGQNDGSYWPEKLLGSYTLKSNEMTREWLKAWHTITHGTTSTDALCWNYYKPEANIPHRSFAPCNSPVVYDENVGLEDLETLELAFLCGLTISETTLKSVSAMVKENGLTAVAGKRFAPVEFAALYNKGTSEFADGKGRWIITDDMASGEVYAAVKPLLGNEGEMVYRFKDRTLVLKISEDGNSFAPAEIC